MTQYVNVFSSRIGNQYQVLIHGSFRSREEDEEILGSEVPYLSIIGVLMYLTNCTKFDILFIVNLLAIFSSPPTK